MTFNINWDKYGVNIKFRGRVNAQDLIDANNYILSNVNFDKINYQIFDFLDIDDFSITSYDINIIGLMDKSQVDFKNKMIVIILTEDEYIIEMIKEYEDLMSDTDWKTKIFPSASVAKAWIKDQ